MHQLSASLWPGHHLMIELKSKLSQLYGSDTSKMRRPELQRKLQLLLDLCNCYDKVSLLYWMGAMFSIFTNSYFQIQYSVTAKHVLLLSELLKIGEAIAKNKLQENIISKDSYSKTVMRLKQRFIHGLLKHQNKAIK